MGDEGPNEDEEDEDFNRFMPTEFLKRLPGVDSTKLTEITRKAKLQGLQTMVDICKAEIETLGAVFGQKNAREIKQFLDKKVDFSDLRS